MPRSGLGRFLVLVSVAALALQARPARLEAHTAKAWQPPSGALSALTNHDRSVETDWTEGYVLVELDEGADLNAARKLVQSEGGTIALMLPPRFLAGWIPPNLDAALVGRAGIRRIERQAHSAAGSSLEKAGAGPRDETGNDAASRAAIRFFDRALRGELRDAVNPAPAPGKPVGPETEPPGMGRPDAFHPEAISELDIAANLQHLGITPPHKGGIASLAANSDRMTGTVSVTLFFVESDGSGIDDNLYDWTATAENDVFDQAAAALSWWSYQAANHSGCWVMFRLEAHYATQDPRCSQWREPVLHPSNEYSDVVSDVLGHFGYTSGGHLSRAAAFDAAARIANGTDWAYSAFAAANPSGPHQFTDGYAAWAYLGGPYVSLLQHSFGWSFKQVFTHETAHMFHACDEYHTPGYGGCSGCTSCADTGIDNGNCEDCNPSPVSCTMRSNAYSVCNWTAGQIGWWRTPCTDHDLPAPILATTAPGEVVQGVEADIELGGDHFVEATTVDFGPGVDVLGLSFISATRLTAHVRVGLDAAPGTRDVTVTGPDGQLARLLAGLKVRNTPRHYVSRYGANIFPYDRPDRAAVDLAAALAACSTGDTLLLAGGDYLPFTLNRTVVLLAGWADDFGARLPADLPSVVDAAGTGPAVSIDGATNTSLLDGLVLRGGRAGILAPPELGPMPCGGALLVVDAAPVLRNCTLESSAAGGSGTEGAGGGAFFWHAKPRLERCLVRANQASRGAGLFFLGSQAVLEDVACSDNDAGGDGLGGGIGALSSRLVVHGGQVSNNIGARDGGGMHLDACTGSSFQRVEIDANGASRYGGGIASHASRFDLTACRVTRNAAGERGGGIKSVADSVQLESSLFAANHAGTLGGGADLEQCTASLVNLTFTAHDGGPGSVYWTGSTSPGTVVGCIFAANAVGGIVAGSGELPTGDWNLFWENGGFDRAGLAVGPHDLAVDPRFVSPARLDFRLGLESPGLDSGDPDPSRRDPDGSRNDRGAQGGPLASPPAPDRPTALRAVATGGARLSWSPSHAPSIVTYVIYRDTIPTLVPSAIQRVGSVDAELTSWVDPAPVGSAWYIVVAVDAAGHASGASPAANPVPPSDNTLPPAALSLHRIAPNPMNPGTWIDYELPAAVEARLEIFAATGARLRVLRTGAQPAGRQRIYWDGRDDASRAVASGVYWVRLAAGDAHCTAKLVVVR